MGLGNSSPLTSHSHRAFFGPWDEYNFWRSLCARWHLVIPLPLLTIPLFHLPTFLIGECHSRLLMMSVVCGTGESRAITWADLARQATGGTRRQAIESRPTAALGLAAPRPAYSALSSERGVAVRFRPRSPATCAILVVLFRDAESLPSIL